MTYAGTNRDRYQILQKLYISHAVQFSYLCELKVIACCGHADTSASKMLGPMIFCMFLLNFGGSEGLMCPAGTFALPILDACYFVSAQTMDWNNAETVSMISTIQCRHIRLS